MGIECSTKIGRCNVTESESKKKSDLRSSQLALNVQVRRKLWPESVRQDSVLNPDRLCSFHVLASDRVDTIPFCLDKGVAHTLGSRLLNNDLALFISWTIL